MLALNIKNLSLLLLFQLLIQQSFAQLDKADKLYSDYKYAQAAEIYKPIADNGNIRAIRKLAECYRKMNDYENAEKYYALVVTDKNAIPKSFLYYGQLLMTNEKYPEAKIWLQKYISLKPDADTTLARTLLQSCESAVATVKSERNLTFENFKVINSTDADFCAIPYEDGILFTSTRKGKINAASGSGFQEVYFANFFLDSLISIEPIKGVVNSKNYNSGPACVDTNKQIIYFTKNNYQFGDAITNKKGDVTLKIFSARKQGDQWKDIKELELNDQEYSCAFPSINSKGDMLFFTSDRAGGYGGKDIYYSILKNGSWSKPKNAGSTINTAGDERYPYIHPDGTLYFSSTGLTGFGGMDIYKSVPNKLGEFGKPINLGKPFNSAADDFGFYLDENYESGFISSNRNGGIGNDDIYRFRFHDIPLELNLYCEGKVADNINVQLKKNDELLEQHSNVKKVLTLLNPNIEYQIIVSKEGYEDEIVTLKTTQNKKTITKSINLVNKRSEN